MEAMIQFGLNQGQRQVAPSSTLNSLLMLGKESRQQLMKLPLTLKSSS